MEWWQIYLLTRLDGLRCHMIIVSSLCGIGCLVILINSLSTRSVFDGSSAHDKEQIKKLEGPEKLLKKRLLPLLIFTSMTIVFIPSQRDIATIIAGHWATHNEEMKKLPDNVLKTLNGLLEKAQEKIK